MAYQQNGGRQYGNRQQNGNVCQNRNGNGRCSRKQAEILQDFGYDPNVSFEQASALITGIQNNGWQRPDGLPKPGQQRPPQSGAAQYVQQQQRAPQQGGQRNNNRCTQRQADLLAKHGYDPSVSFDEASAIIDELAANNWQRPDGQQQPQGGQFQGTYHDGNGNSAPLGGTYLQDGGY